MMIVQVVNQPSFMAVDTAQSLTWPISTATGELYDRLGVAKLRRLIVGMGLH